MHDDRFPAEPYPGATPGWSFVHLDATSHPLRPDPSVPSGWRRGADDLDAWLEVRGAATLAQRVPVLAYGSNRCPSKITWLRTHLGLRDPVVVLRATVHGVAAVWAAGTRARDGVRPATPAVVTDAVEEHAVWMATPEQVAVLDACEGRGERYDLVRLHTGRVVTDDGAEIDAPWTYWPASPHRSPLLVDGAPVRCRDVDEPTARALVGTAARPADGVVTVQHGAPDPRDWPARVFAYGTLQPGERAWPLMAAHARGEPAPGWMPGRVHDTGRGYPALRLTAGDVPAEDTASGTIVALASPAASLPVLDEYEGPEYRRVRRVTYRAPGSDAPGSDAPNPDAPGTGPVHGSPCWVWVWIDASEAAAWPPVRGRWGA